MLDRPGTRSLVAVVAVTTWIGAVASGFALLWRYKSTPVLATVGAAPSTWPRASRLEITPHRSTLLFFAHPLCPCTRASISELARLVPRLGDAVATVVVVARPRDVSPDWDDAELWTRARSIPGVVVVRDDDGVEARRFHAAASGLTLLYDTDGRLRFSGGLTSARGHEGESFGQERLLSIVKTGTADRTDSPVFGCALPRHDDDETNPEEGTRE